MTVGHFFLSYSLDGVFGEAASCNLPRLFNMMEASAGVQGRSNDNGDAIAVQVVDPFGARRVDGNLSDGSSALRSSCLRGNGKGCTGVKKCVKVHSVRVGVPCFDPPFGANGTRHGMHEASSKGLALTRARVAFE